MSHFSDRIVRPAVTALPIALLLLGAGMTLAGKPDEPGKPGGGGGRSAYTLVTLDDGEGMATDIRQQGDLREVVGISYADKSARYWMLDNRGQIVFSTDLQTAPVAPGEVAQAGADGMNGSGTIVGWQQRVGVDYSLRPLIWRDLSSAPVELDLPPGFVGNGQAAEVNDDLLVVGNLWSETGQHSIVAWQVADVDGQFVVVDSLVIATGDQAGLACLNNQGYVAATFDERAYRWRVTWNTDPAQLEVSSTERLFDVYSLAADINEAGTVCGQVFSGLDRRPFAITLDGALLDFPLLVDNRKEISVNYSASAINDAPIVQVAGASDVFSKRTGAFVSEPAVLWNTGNDAVELPISWIDSGIYALDDGGWAAGASQHVPFVLIPAN